MKLFVIGLIFLGAILAAAMGLSNMSKEDIVKKGFEQIESSDFEAVRAMLADGFEFSGPVPEPVALFSTS